MGEKTRSNPKEGTEVITEAIINVTTDFHITVR